VLPDALRFCFDVCTRGTSIEGATLEIADVPGRGACRDCGGEIDLADPWTRCPCGSARVDVIRGEELRLEAVEVV
jgi:hydrogenase nickel incorporation protein HypA/HybF